MRSIYLAIIFFAVIAGCKADGDRGGNDQHESLQKQREKALLVTGAAFSRILEESSGGEWEYGEYVSDIKNYNVSVRVRGDKIEVEYSIKQPKESELSGGGARYVVDGKTGSILFFEGYK